MSASASTKADISFYEYTSWSKTCGTRLFCWRKNGTAPGVAPAVFDDRNAFAPTGHIWVKEKMNWVKLQDGLPQYPETVPL